MLYLNQVKKITDKILENLTLTNVVFEYSPLCEQLPLDNNLTLTNVVFEFCNLAPKKL